MMRRRGIRGHGMMVLLVAACMPMMTGALGSCNFMDIIKQLPVVLLDTTVPAQDVAGDDGFAAGNFTPSAVGKIITVTVTGNVSSSRPRVRVRETTSTTLMAKSDDLPTTNPTVVVFESSSTAQHTVYIKETTTGQAAASFTVKVEQTKPAE